MDPGTGTWDKAMQGFLLLFSTVYLEEGMEIPERPWKRSK